MDKMPWDSGLPMAGTPADHERTALANYWDAVKAGKTAYKLGIPLRHCPPFRDARMIEAWKVGWTDARHQDEEQREYVLAFRRIGWFRRAFPATFALMKRMFDWRG